MGAAPFSPLLRLTRRHFDHVTSNLRQSLLDIIQFQALLIMYVSNLLSSWHPFSIVIPRLDSFSWSTMEELLVYFCIDSGGFVPGLMEFVIERILRIRVISIVAK